MNYGTRLLFPIHMHNIDDCEEELVDGSPDTYKSEVVASSVNWDLDLVNEDEFDWVYIEVKDWADELAVTSTTAATRFTEILATDASALTVNQNPNPNAWEIESTEDAQQLAINLTWISSDEATGLRLTWTVAVGQTAEAYQAVPCYGVTLPMYDNNPSFKLRPPIPTEGGPQYARARGGNVAGVQRERSFTWSGLTESQAEQLKRGIAIMQGALAPVYLVVDNDGTGTARDATFYRMLITSIPTIKRDRDEYSFTLTGIELER